MHSGYADYFLLSGRIKKKFQLPIIHTMYCPIPERGGRSRLPGIHALICWWANQLNSSVGISENVVRSMAGYGIKQPGCIRPALDLVRFTAVGDNAATRRELGLSINDQLILFVGNAKPQKNVLGVLRALQKLRHEFPRAKLIITTELKHSSTDVDLAALAEAVRSMKLESSIVQRGIVNDMPALMRASDVLVAPFLDTYGPSDYFMAALEAMACSKPVVVSNVGGMPEIISDDVGRLVDPNDVNSIAAGLRVFLSNDEARSASGAKARKVVERSFDPKRIVQEYSAVYERIHQ
jgi:glycosyltransferase involved in cell wall biosynthesis